MSDDIELGGHSFFQPYPGEWACRHCDLAWAGANPTEEMLRTDGYWGCKAVKPALTKEER